MRCKECGRVVTPVCERKRRIEEAERKVIEHAIGLCFGVDWNKGTAAGYHRKPLEKAVAELKAARGEV